MKPRPPFDKREAAVEGKEAASWQCQSCSQMIEPEMSGPHCYSCASYWRDVEDGLFDDHDDWMLDDLV